MQENVVALPIVGPVPMQLELVESVVSHWQGGLADGRSNVERQVGNYYHRAYVLLPVFVLGPTYNPLLIQLSLAQSCHPFEQAAYL